MVSYPKLAASDTTRGTLGGMNTSTNGVVPFQHEFQANTALQVAPYRYSNVRKVVFSFTTGKDGNGTTSTAKMRIRIASTTTPALTVQKFSLPVSTILEGNVDYGMKATQLIRPSLLGPVTTIVDVGFTSEQERDHAQILQMEFDRADSDADDFFTAWDAFDDDDDYMLIQAAVDSITADTEAVIAYRFKNFQCAVIQEDDFKNNTSTDWHSFIGCKDVSENTTAYQGATTGPRMPFRYVAADWNGLDSVSAIFYGVSTAGTTQLTVRVYNVTDDAEVIAENFTTTNSRWYVARTQNFLSLLTDGKDYFIDYLLNAVSVTLHPEGTGYFCLVQKNFTRTATFHQITNLSFTPTTVSTCDSGAILFDPSWYTDGGEIRESKMVSAFIHNDAGNNPRQSLRLDSNLLSDDSARGSGTAKDMTPEHTFPATTPTGPKIQFTDILTNDPMDESGQVRLQKSYLGSSTWVVGAGDYPGHIGVYYALTIPRSAEMLSQFGSGDPAFDTDIGPI